MLEEFRTSEEILNYFKSKGLNITKEEVNNLKKQYERNNLKVENKLNMKQLNDVAGGIRYEVHIGLNPSTSESVGNHIIQHIKPIETGQPRVEGITIHQDGFADLPLAPQQMANMLNGTEKLILPDGDTLDTQAARLFITNVLTFRGGHCITEINPKANIEKLKDKLFLGEPSQTAIAANAEKKPLTPTSSCVDSTTGHPSNASARAAEVLTGGSQPANRRNRSCTINVVRGEEKIFFDSLKKQAKGQGSQPNVQSDGRTLHVNWPNQHTTSAEGSTSNPQTDKVLSPRHHRRQNAGLPLKLDFRMTAEDMAKRGVPMHPAMLDPTHRTISGYHYPSSLPSSPPSESSKKNGSPGSPPPADVNKHGGLLHRTRSLFGMKENGSSDSSSELGSPKAETPGFGVPAAVRPKDDQGASLLGEKRSVPLSSLFAPYEIEESENGAISYIYNGEIIFQLTPDAGFYNTSEEAIANWIRSLELPNEINAIMVDNKRKINLMRDATTKEIYAFEYEEPNESTIVFCRIFTKVEENARNGRIQANFNLSMLIREGLKYIADQNILNVSPHNKAIDKLITKTPTQLSQLRRAQKIIDTYGGEESKVLSEIARAGDKGPSTLYEAMFPFQFNAKNSKFEINPYQLYDLLITRSNINGEFINFSRALTKETGYNCKAVVIRNLNGLEVKFNYSFSSATEAENTATIVFTYEKDAHGEYDKTKLKYTITMPRKEPMTGSFYFSNEITFKEVDFSNREPDTKDMPAIAAACAAAAESADGQLNVEATKD